MNLRVLTRAIKIDQSLGIPESGIPEGAFVKKNTAGVPSLSSLPPPLAVFFCSHLCALSPRSERMEQANVPYRASGHAFLPHEPRGAGTRNKAPRTRLHEVNLPSETLKEKTHSMANLLSFLLP